MSAKIHSLHTSLPDEIKTPVGWEEQLCAFADGELSNADCTRLFAQLEREVGNDALLHQWRAMHLAGEAMRAPHVFAARSEAAEDAFLHKLRVKLASEPFAQKPVVRPQLTPAPIVQTVPQAGTEAANAAVFRWKMAAGFASLAAVAAIGWSNLPQLGQGAGGNTQTQLAQQTRQAQPASPASQASAEVFALRSQAGQGNAPLGLVAGGGTSLAGAPLNVQAPARSQPGLALVGANNATPQNLGGVSLQPADDVMIRDARLDELLARQYGRTLALQPPAAFMRNTQLSAAGGQ